MFGKMISFDSLFVRSALISISVQTTALAAKKMKTFRYADKGGIREKAATPIIDVAARNAFQFLAKKRYSFASFGFTPAPLYLGAPTAARLVR